MNEEKTPCLDYFCRQTGKCFCRQTVTTRHILQRQKSPLKGCLQKAFIKATHNAGFPDGSLAPKPAVHSKWLRIPAVAQILLSKEAKQAAPTWESPGSCSGSAQDWCLLPQGCAELCQAVGFHPALSSAAPISVPDFAYSCLLQLSCAQTPLDCDASFSSFTSSVMFWHRPSHGSSADPFFLSRVSSPSKAERGWYVVNRKCCAGSSHFIACALPSLCWNHFMPESCFYHPCALRPLHPLCGLGARGPPWTAQQDAMGKPPSSQAHLFAFLPKWCINEEALTLPSHKSPGL